MYPLTHDGAFLASPNTVFEVECTDSEIKEKINLWPQLDVIYDANGNQLVFAVDLPGFNKKDIRVEVENGYLLLAGKP